MAKYHPEDNVVQDAGNEEQQQNSDSRRASSSIKWNVNMSPEPEVRDTVPERPELTQVQSIPVVIMEISVSVHCDFGHEWDKTIEKSPCSSDEDEKKSRRSLQHGQGLEEIDHLWSLNGGENKLDHEIKGRGAAKVEHQRAP